MVIFIKAKQKEMVKKTQSIEGKNPTVKAFSHPDWFLPYILIEATLQCLQQHFFLAALSSSRSLVVRRLVCLSVCLSGGVCEKVTCRVSNGN